jgi:hypothetical protein
MMKQITIRFGEKMPLLKTEVVGSTRVVESTVYKNMEKYLILNS